MIYDLKNTFPKKSCSNKTLNLHKEPQLKNRLKRTAFFIRAYNDVDHFSPLIAEFILNKENPVVVINTDLEIDNDYRFKYLKTLGTFEIFQDPDDKYIKYSKGKGFLNKILKNFI